MEAFRRYVEATNDGNKSCWVWAEVEMQKEWEWTGLDMPGDDVDENITAYLDMSRAHYPMIRREAFTKAVVSLYKLAEQNVSDIVLNL